ncbi:hypothetical protein GCM10027586_14270 [Kineococcus gypseus]|uniref:hypothetical protein n=1 Tax=Kineococcus gypseus TaxID=1637102 RepID=UPI003D7E6D78
MRLRGGALVLALLLAGCSSSGEQSDIAEYDTLTGVDLSKASAAQAEDMGDHEATAEEYQAGFQRFRECLSAAGFELTDVDLSGPVYDFGVPDAAVQAGADARCYESEFYYVDMLWQTSDEIQDSSETAKFVHDCLRRNNVEPEDTLQEMGEQLREAGIEPPECLR